MLRCFLSFSLIGAFALMPVCSSAQVNDGVWDNVKERGKKTKSRIDKTKKGVLGFKKHIEEWGLDSNYTHHIALGGKLNTNGWSGCLYYLKKRKPGNSHVWMLSFSEIKHEKQLKQERKENIYKDLGAASPFVFGKINNLYTLQLGYGREQVLLPNVVDDNLSVSFRYCGGLSVAMLKPYYLKLVYIDYATGTEQYSLKEEKYSDSNGDIFLKQSNILGASKWSMGLDEMQYVPGLFLDAAFAIEPAKNKTFVQTITVGVNAAYYTKSLPVMAELKARPWQVSLYAGLALGKRW